MGAKKNKKCDCNKTERLINLFVNIFNGLLKESANKRKESEFNYGKFSAFYEALNIIIKRSEVEGIEISEEVNPEVFDKLLTGVDKNVQKQG